MLRLPAATLAVLALCAVFASCALSQSAAPTPRVFARGVLTTIPPQLVPEETFSRKPMIEITSNKALDWQPQTFAETRTLYSKAEDASFTNEIWGLQFTFKPLRMINVDVRQPNGQTERKLLWYLVYNVENTGERIRPVQDETGTFSAESAEPEPIQFLPHFVLEGQDVDSRGNKIYKAYLDRVMPSVMETIRQRETPGRELLTSAQIAEKSIAVSTESQDNSVWGVAIWELVDPEMDFLSVFVGGLTNAHEWADTPGNFQPGDPAGKGRRIMAKTLQLNFWRPGDEYQQNEKEIRYGTPPGKASLYGVEEGVAYQWTFR